MNDFVERLGWVLLHSLWQFVFVALLAGVIVQTMRRSSATARYVVLVGAMSLMIVAPLVTWWMLPSNATTSQTSREASAPGPVMSGDLGPGADAPRLADDADGINERDPVPEGDRRTEGVSPLVVAESNDAPATRGLTPPVRPWSERVKTALRPWLAWIVAAWSIGVLACSLRPLLGWHTLWRLRRIGVSPVSENVQAAMRRISERLRWRRAVSVLQSALAQVPVVVGYFKPVILLPVSLMTSLPAEQLEAVLAHELAHVRRHDFLVNLLQTLVETLGFYHPAVWWLSHRIRVEREHCCDDLVVSWLGNRIDYGRALVAIEELRGRSTLLALGAADGSLLARVRRILGVTPDRAAIRPSDRWPAAFVTFGCLLLLALGTFVSSRAENEKAVTEHDHKASVAQVVATVNGVEILDMELLERYGEGLKRLRATTTPEQFREQCDKLVARDLTKRIEQELLAQEAKSKLTTEEEKQFQSLVEQEFSKRVETLRIELKAANEQELDKLLQAMGTSLKSVKAQWLNRLLAQQCLAKRLEENPSEKPEDVIRKLWNKAVITRKFPEPKPPIRTGVEQGFLEKWSRAGFESPDPALDPTAGLPNSDEETKSANSANGDLRSNPATGSGDTRRADEKPQPRVAIHDVVRGVDFSKVKVLGYRDAMRQTPDLHVPDPQNPDSWTRPKNVFPMPLAEHTWLKYPAGSGHFYIEHRADGSPESEQQYGPIEGDPFEVLKLEELLREQLKPSINSVGGDPRYRLRLMFRTGEPGLIRRAWSLSAPELARKFEDRNEQGLFERLEMLEIVREALQKEAAAFRKPEMLELAAQMQSVVSDAEASIDVLNDSVPDDNYESRTYLQPKIVAKLPDVLWGKPVDGLRLGLVPRDWQPDIDWYALPADASLPTSVSVQPGQELRYQLIVENVSDHEIKLSGYVAGEEMARSIEVLDQSSQPVSIDSLHTTIPHLRSYWRLKPGERQMLMMPAVYFEPASPDGSSKGLGYHVNAGEGGYSLRCSIWFGDLDNDRHRHVPGKSEWIGKLTTGSQTVTVDVADAGRGSPDPDPTAGLPNADEAAKTTNNSNGVPQSKPAAELPEAELLRKLVRGGKIDSKTINALITLVAARGTTDAEFARLVLAEFEKSCEGGDRTSQSRRHLLAVLTDIFEAWSSPGWRSQLSRFNPDDLPQSIPPQVDAKLGREMLARVIQHGYATDRSEIANVSLAVRQLHHPAGREFLRDVLRDPGFKSDFLAPSNPTKTVPQQLPQATPTPKSNSEAPTASRWKDNTGGGWTDAKFVAAVGLAELGEAEGIDWLLARAQPNEFGIDASLWSFPHLRDPRGSLLESSRLSLADLFGLPAQVTATELADWWRNNRTKFTARPATLKLRAGRGSPDPALAPTAGLLKSDKVTKSANSVNGDLRSKPAAGSGDPRRAQIATDEPTKTTQLVDIIQRLTKEEQKYNRIEVIVHSHQQPLKVLNNETQEVEIVRRLIRDQDLSYYLEESFCRVQESGATSLIIHEETIQGRWWRQRIESNGPRAAKHSNDSLFVLPKPKHRLGPHTLALGYSLDRPESLSGILTDETPGRRKIIELLGEEIVGKQRCVKLKEREVSAGGSKSYRLIWLALDKNLLPVRCERCDNNVERTQPLGFTQVTEWLEVQPGTWFPKCIEVHQTQKAANGSDDFESVRTHKLTVELVTLQPQFERNLFDKLGKPPSNDPSPNAKARVEQEVPPLGVQSLRKPALLLPDHWIVQTLGFDNERGQRAGHGFESELHHDSAVGCGRQEVDQRDQAARGQAWGRRGAVSNGAVVVVTAATPLRWRR